MGSTWTIGRFLVIRIKPAFLRKFVKPLPLYPKEALNPFSLAEGTNCYLWCLLACQSLCCPSHLLPYPKHFQLMLLTLLITLLCPSFQAPSDSICTGVKSKFHESVVKLDDAEVEMAACQNIHH